MEQSGIAVQGGTRRMIGFVGLSHLGIVSSIAAAAKGFSVIAYDSDAALCTGLGEGRLPLFEPRLAEVLAETRERIHFTADPAQLSRCELIYFAYDVPTDAANQSIRADLATHLEHMARLSGQGAILVLLSPISPGFTRQLSEKLRQTRRDLTLYHQVGTLVTGRALERAMQPEQLIIGCDKPTTPLPDHYARFLGTFQCPVLLMTYESAELAKISINMYLAACLATTNTLAELCESVGADWSEIVPALKLDRRIGPHAYLAPGLGIAGGNLERDLVTVRRLAEEHGTDAGMVDAWFANSRARCAWVLRTLHAEVMAWINTPALAVWGLACKPDTSSTKNSPALGLLEALRSFQIRAYDPQVHLDAASYPNVRHTESALAACVGADALVIMTPWSEFGAVEPRRLAEEMRGRVLIDPFGVLDHRKSGELGFAHFRLGVTPRRIAA